MQIIFAYVYMYMRYVNIFNLHVDIYNATVCYILYTGTISAYMWHVKMTKLHVYSIHLAFKDQLEICHHRKGLLIHDYSICVGEYRMLAWRVYAYLKAYNVTNARFLQMISTKYCPDKTLLEHSTCPWLFLLIHTSVSWIIIGLSCYLFQYSVSILGSYNFATVSTTLRPYYIVKRFDWRPLNVPLHFDKFVS